MLTKLSCTKYRGGLIQITLTISQCTCCTVLDMYICVSHCKKLKIKPSLPSPSPGASYGEAARRAGGGRYGQLHPRAPKCTSARRCNNVYRRLVDSSPATTVVLDRGFVCSSNSWVCRRLHAAAAGLHTGRRQICFFFWLTDVHSILMVLWTLKV